MVTLYCLISVLRIVPLQPWKNWDFVHADFNTIWAFPAILDPESLKRLSYLTWWIVPSTAFVFLVFFPHAREDLDVYRNMLDRLRGRDAGRVKAKAKVAKSDRPGDWRRTVTTGLVSDLFSG